MSRQCPACKTALRDTASFCDTCGQKLTPLNLETTVLPVQPTLTAAVDVATIALPETAGTLMTISPMDDGATMFMLDMTADDGDTIAMPDPAPPTDDGATVVMANLAKDDGGAIAMPNAAPPPDDGLTRTMPDTEPDRPVRFSRSVPDRSDEDGVTTAISAANATTGETIQAALAQPATRPHPPQADLNVGQALQNRYRLDKILGRGGFGAVYLAQDIKLKRMCVVKQMLTPRAASPRDIALHQANFEREADLLVQLNHPGHPNIPEIYDYFSDSGGNYLVMKYIEGRSLKDTLDQGEGKIPWREAARYVVDVSDALNYMHTLAAEPVMHRDIKPANILLGNDGRVWLVDFGLAKANPVEGVGGEGVTKAAGSIGYTPFEQWLGEATPASDVYALGATLHHLITGLNPAASFGQNMNIQKLQDMHGRFTPLRKIDRSLPKELDGIAAQAVSAAPNQRPTALQLKQQLGAMISGAREVGLFTFKSGESAKTTPHLVNLCEKYRREAEGYLYNGDFERWFLIINRNDLAEAATQAVKRGKNQADGLEKFLKLALPNLFWRRLGRAGWQLTRQVAQVILVTAAVLLLVVVGGSYLARWFIQQSIAGNPWDYSALNFRQNNRYTEQFLVDKFTAAVGLYVSDITVDVYPPDHFDLSARWAGLPLRLPANLRLEDKKPHFYLTQVNDTPLWAVGDNLTAGINSGIDYAFARGPVDVSSLAVQDGAVVFGVEPSGRVPLLLPTPTPAAGPTPTPTPVNLTLVAVFNDLGYDLTLEIDGQTWQIAANDSKVIEKEPGSYHYTVRYAATGQLAAQGVKQWERKVYRWRIGLDE